MASRYYGLNRGGENYVVESSSTTSKDVQFVIDLAIGMTRVEALLLMSHLLNSIKRGNWPILSAAGVHYLMGIDRGEFQKDITTSQSTYATLTNQTLVYTAVTADTGGNSITIALVDPAGNDQALAVSVIASAISVSLATGPAGAITTTRAQLVAAINANAAAAALVSVAGSGATAITALAATNLATGAAPSISTGVWLDLDMTAGLTKSDVTTLLKKIENHIIRGNWPPA